jgi:hypothetical protein
VFSFVQVDEDTETPIPLGEPDIGGPVAHKVREMRYGVLGVDGEGVEEPRGRVEHFGGYGASNSIAVYWDLHCESFGENFVSYFVGETQRFVELHCLVI